MAGWEERIKMGGKAIQLFTGGAGAPLLFLHGAGVYWWMPAHELLAAGLRVQAPVLPGLGGSEGYEEIEGMDDLVFHTLDVVDALGLERADVVGLSLGGWLAAELALRHPGRVNRLVLVDAAGTRVPGIEREDLFMAGPARARGLLFAHPQSGVARPIVPDPPPPPPLSAPLRGPQPPARPLPTPRCAPPPGRALSTASAGRRRAAERLGFDVIGANEHHQHPSALMPSPNIMAAPLTQRPSRIKILVLGNALPLYDHPQRVAEELAMLDVLSNGRLITGMVVGLGVEAFTYEINPTFIRARYREAHELIVRVRTAPVPFHFAGKHYDFRLVNVWPRPIQKPHPPIWIPGSGSVETIRFVAERRYPWVARPYSQFAVMKRT